MLSSEEQHWASHIFHSISSSPGWQAESILGGSSEGSKRAWSSMGLGLSGRSSLLATGSSPCFHLMGEVALGTGGGVKVVELVVAATRGI